MISAIILSLLSFQPTAASQDTPLTIWEQIAQLESHLTDLVAETDSRFTVFHSDPVRGYYIDRSGVVIMIPIRYQHIYKGHLIPPESENPVALPSLDKSPKTLSSIAIRKKLNEWRSEVQKLEAQKNADFERLVNEIKIHVPNLVEALTGMTSGENLILIIEERVPPWYFAGLSTKNEPTRKVVTLTIDKDLISQMHAHQTDVPNDLLSHIKRTTVDRKLANIVP